MWVTQARIYDSESSTSRHYGEKTMCMRAIWSGMIGYAMIMQSLAMHKENLNSLYSLQ